MPVGNVSANMDEKVHSGLTSRTSEDYSSSSNGKEYKVEKMDSLNSPEDPPYPGMNRNDSGIFSSNNDSDDSGDTTPKTGCKSRWQLSELVLSDEDYEPITMKRIVELDRNIPKADTTRNKGNEQSVDGSLEYNSTSVTPKKCREKSLQIKGYKNEDYDEDMKAFRSVVRKQKYSLRKLRISAEDCCNVTKTSTILDLQNKDFNDFRKVSKDEFLKTFVISGIPIYSPHKDTALMNPWIFSIRRILKPPYTILSQVVLENVSNENHNLVYEQNKGVQLQGNNIQTCFNAVIPVFPPYVAPQMREIMKTHIYTLCCTNAILRNPQIIDCNIHMAALGILWVRMLYENPEQPRPEYVDYCIKCIEATAAQYSERLSFDKYRDLLINKTNQALMTESTDEIDESTFKCESLVKPMFILHMAINSKHITDKANIKKIVKSILIEYIGRCLSNIVQQDISSASEKRKYSDNNIKPNDKSSIKKSTFSEKTDRQDTRSALRKTKCFDFFKIIYPEQENIQVNEKKYFEETKTELLGDDIDILKKNYHKEQCRKAAKVAAKEVTKRNCLEIANNFTIKVDEQKVNQLRNVSACGDVSWPTLRIFSKEIGLLESDVDDIFSEENICCYIAHGIQYKNSRDRLKIPISDYNKCVEEITKKECSKEVVRIIGKLVEEIENFWISSYLHAHADVVEPMTQSQIIQEARAKDINVSEENFDQVFMRYRQSEGLLGNACQARKCPWFLWPKRDYSAHAATEKRSSDFPYGLHIATKSNCKSDVRTIKDKIITGECRKPNKAKTQGTTHERLANLNINHLKRSYMQMDEQ